MCFSPMSTTREFEKSILSGIFTPLQEMARQLSAAMVDSPLWLVSTARKACWRTGGAICILPTHSTCEFERSTLLARSPHLQATALVEPLGMVAWQLRHNWATSE